MLHDAAKRQVTFIEFLEDVKELVMSDKVKDAAFFVELRDGGYYTMYIHAEGQRHISLSLLGIIGIWKTKMENATLMGQIESPLDDSPPTG